MFVLVPADVPKGSFVESLPGALIAALRRHNGKHHVAERIQLRMALHAGEVTYDDHGATACVINLVFRLLEAPALKAALTASAGELAVVTSPWFFDEVVTHSAVADPSAYSPIPVTIKETSTVGWMWLPDRDGSSTVIGVGPGRFGRR